MSKFPLEKISFESKGPKFPFFFEKIRALFNKAPYLRDQPVVKKKKTPFFRAGYFGGKHGSLVGWGVFFGVTLPETNIYPLRING